jgi:hypothetical protein
MHQPNLRDTGNAEPDIRGNVRAVRRGRDCQSHAASDGQWRAGHRFGAGHGFGSGHGAGPGSFTFTGRRSDERTGQPHGPQHRGWAR